MVEHQVFLTSYRTARKTVSEQAFQSTYSDSGQNRLTTEANLQLNSTGLSAERWSDSREKRHIWDVLEQRDLLTQR